jgi:hypothetical protein
MPLDPYMPCPCGSGKKLKFCECSAESSDLEKVLTAIDGDQRVAAVHLIDNVLARKPQQKAMLALKSIIQLQLGDRASAKQATNDLLSVASTNPVGLSISAILAVAEGRTREAVVSVQKALAHSQKEVHFAIPDAVYAVAEALLREEQYVAAKQHALVRLGMYEKGDDRTSLSFLMEFFQDRDIPLVCKQDLFPHIPAASAPWKDEAETFLTGFAHGIWLDAAARFTELDKKHPQDPEILYNLACFRTFLADPEASRTWRRYAELPGLDAEEAMEAEMLAQAIDGSVAGEEIDEIRMTYAVKDMSRLMEVLATDRRTIRMEIDFSKTTPEGIPPPRAGYFLLDRELPENGADLTLDTVPRVLGDVYLYGRETDREARLEFVVSKTTDLAAKVRKLQEVGREHLGMIEKEEKIATTSSAEEALLPRWNLPADTPPEVLRRLTEEKERQNILEIIPKLPHKVLDGRSPREVAADPQYRLRLLALIRSYELEQAPARRKGDYNELRRVLGLAVPAPLDPAGVDFQRMPVVRLDRFDLEKASDEQLREAYIGATRTNHFALLEKVAHVVLERPPSERGLARSVAFEVLATVSSNLDDALKYNQLAQQAALEEGKSPARLLIGEFDLRLARNEPDEVVRLLTTLQSKHVNEPGIAQALYMRLMQIGAIGPDGLPRTAAAPREPAAAIYPGSTPVPAAGEQKSKLWLPE